MSALKDEHGNPSAVRRFQLGVLLFTAVVGLVAMFSAAIERPAWLAGVKGRGFESRLAHRARRRPSSWRCRWGRSYWVAEPCSIWRFLVCG